MQSPISPFTSFVRQQAEVVSTPTSEKRVRPFAETANGNPSKTLRLSPDDRFRPDESMQEPDCMQVTTASENHISQSDWLLVHTLNRNVFTLLTQVAHARLCDPAILLNQQLETRYPGINVLEHRQNTGSVIHVHGDHIRVRQDFMNRITAFSDEASALIARALLTDCIICKLCELYQNGQIYISELKNMNAGCQAQFLESRQAMLQAYRNTAALPMPDQFSTLCVLDDIPL